MADAVAADAGTVAEKIGDLNLREFLPLSVDGEDAKRDETDAAPGGGFIPFPIQTEVYLFDPVILKGLSPTYPLGFYRPVAGNENLVLRPLKSSDFRHQYVSLIGQLSLAGDTDENKFLRAFKAMKRCPETYYVYVLENPNDHHRVIASATFIIEQKFLRGCGKRGLLEDLVVCDSFRGRQLGKFMVAVSEHLSRSMNVYKLTLTCRDEMVPFYSKLGFASEDKNDNYMTMRFESGKIPNPN